jgi:RNase adapter protein RapZ
MSETVSKKPGESQNNARDGEQRKLTLNVISFGYKEAAPPLANMVFDVRFLKNPYWVPELRPLTGLDEPVAEYVLNQQLAVDFLESVCGLLSNILPRFEELEIDEFSVALGCTGGQHRSTSIAEALARRIAESFPDVNVVTQHRELIVTR